MTVLKGSIQLKGKTAAQWTTANPTLLARQPGVEMDTRKWKVGDGVTAWNALPYMVSMSPAPAWGDLTGLIANQADLQAELDAKTNQADFTLHISDFSNPHNTTKAQVGLGNADNTSDLNKPVSTAQAAAIAVVQADIDAHQLDTNNPHNTTKAQVGLGNADNTSDANKPISTATQSALDLKADLVGGVIPSSQIPSIAITEFKGAVASEAAMLALTGERGDWCIRIDMDMAYILVNEDPTQAANWVAIPHPQSPVMSVNGQTGVVVLDKFDIGLDQVDNTSDADKPISTATQTALNAKENSIAAGTVDQYWRGDKSWQDFGSAVRASALTGLNLTINATISALDTTLSAFGKLQKQITDLTGSFFAHTGDTGNPHNVTKTQVGLGNVDNVQQQPLDSDLTAIAALTPANDDIIQRKAGSWVSRTLSQYADDIRSLLVSDVINNGEMNHAPTQNAVYDLAASILGLKRTVMLGGCFIQSLDVTGVYWIFVQQNARILQGNGSSAPPALIYLDPAEYPSILGRTPKLRLRTIISNNDTAPGQTATVGLYSVTRPASSGGIGVSIFTVGAQVTAVGERIASGAIAADQMQVFTGDTFAIPAAGYYAMGVNAAGTWALNSGTHFNTELTLVYE